MTSTPTEEQIEAFQAIFNHFNRELFAEALPPVMLVFSRGRSHRTSGHFAPKRWSDGSTQLDEISLNPDALDQPAQEIAATIVHEMCHLWQSIHGKPSRSGYHNNEWAKKMEAVGVVPSNTGQPGGRRVGQQMADYPIEGGAFLRAFAQLQRSLPFSSGFKRATKAGGRDSSKTRYTCPQCRVNIWGKLGLAVICGGCQVAFVVS